MDDSPYQQNTSPARQQQPIPGLRRGLTTLNSFEYRSATKNTHSPCIFSKSAEQLKGQGEAQVDSYGANGRLLSHGDGNAAPHQQIAGSAHWPRAHTGETDRAALQEQLAEARSRVLALEGSAEATQQE